MNATEHGMLFIPSVAPGYIDTRIRPFNSKNTRSREEGKFYDRMFEAALAAPTRYVSITSFNEWHEGTQIEPSIPKRSATFVYEDYSPLAPDDYLKRTRHWVNRWRDAPDKNK